ncbi:MAG TPA: 3' terminal RNA ribose 2'-O-methyltransferase Hen1, partial [Solirubrobacterales bacterium]|nr:3' terminal RNA ribose 2'-O-methyltransferase Hen1 [Solirubrobacterales bacterium]
RVEVDPIPLDPDFPEWGEGRHVGLRLAADCRLAELLVHLYVLLPVLDEEKHYWVDETEIEKLMRRGEGWLAGHPERELIVRRYLKNQASLFYPALARLDEGAPVLEPDRPEPEQQLEQRVSLRDRRLEAVEAVLKESGARRVLDLGCGSGALLGRLLRDGYEEVVGVDVSVRALEQAARRLKLDEMHDDQRRRIALLHSPLTYRDKRLAGFDAAALVEVIEHLDPPRLAAVEQNVFGSARPATVVVTTPNSEYNVRWEGLAEDDFRHSDHRFEWTRAEFAEWAAAVADRHGYGVRHLPVGDEDPEVGPPTQMAVFNR